MSEGLILYYTKCPVCKNIIEVNNKNMITLHYHCWIEVLKDMEEIKRKIKDD